MPTLTRSDNALHVRRRDLLRYSDFRRLLLSQFTSQASDAAGTVILAGLVLFLTPKGPATSQIATMVATSALPILLAGPLSGFMADRFTRRGIMFHGQMLRVVLVLGLLFAALFDVDPVMFVIWAVSLCTSKVLYTARLASIRHLVRNHELVAADSASLTVGTVAGVVGGGCGVALLWLIGPTGFVIVAIGHAMSALWIRTIAGSTGGGREHTIARWSEVLEHLRVPKLRYAMTATGLNRLLLGVVLACVALIGDGSNANSAVAFAAVMGASGLGTFIGTNTAEWVNEHFSRRMMTLLAFTSTAIMFTLMVIVDTRIAYLLGFGFSTFVFQNIRLCSDATVQSNAIPGAGGREFALYDVNHNLLFLVGLLIGLLTFDPTNGRVIIAVCATVSALSALAFLFMSRSENRDRPITHKLSPKSALVQSDV